MKVRYLNLNKPSIKENTIYKKTTNQDVGTNSSSGLSKSDSNLCKSGHELTLFVTLCLLIFVLAALDLYVYRIINCELASGVNKELRELAVPCEDFSLSRYDDPQVFDVVNNGLKVYVGQDWRYMCICKDPMKLVKMFLERQARLRISKGRNGPMHLACGNDSMVPKSGHLAVSLTELSGPQNCKAGEYICKLKWNKASNTSYVHHAVQLEDEEIIIAESRTYFVYISAHFNLSSKTETEYISKRPIQLSVVLYRLVNGYEQVLLGKTNLYSITRNDTATSLSTGGAAILMKGERVVAKVTGVERLLHKSTGTAFGVFPL